MMAPVAALILFDIDGTIIRAGDPDHRRAFDEALRAVYGVPASLDGLELGGMLDSQLARLALAPHRLPTALVEERLDQLMREMGQRYGAAVAPGDRVGWVLPGVVATAQRLAATGHTVGVLTGNNRWVAEAKLGAAGVGALFRLGAFGDRAAGRAELVVEARRAAGGRGAGADRSTVLVGDTPLDVAAAHAAGACALAVATGRWTMAELAGSGADAVLPDLADVDAAVALVDALLVADGSDGKRPPGPPV
ncbi:MAG: HAD family hydrolase [Acidimicrobiales bacterium]|nr:HAD family hydrolase [Acidimicrobiales bacterium]